MTDAGGASISVVIPAFNAERWIDETLASVTNQTLPALEIVVVDDGSTDRTAAIAQAHVAVRVLRRPNGGAGAAINTGLTTCTGRYVAILGADDIWASSMIASVSTAIAATQADIIGFQSLRFAGEAPSQHHERAVRQPRLIRAPFETLLSGNFLVQPVVRRTLYTSVGGYSLNLRNLEDWDCWLRMAQAGARRVYRPDPLLLSPAREQQERRQAIGSQEPGGDA